MTVTSQRLFDATVRHQVFLEGLKNGASVAYRPVLHEMNKELVKLFQGIRYDTLADMPKHAVVKLLKQVAKLSQEIVDPYVRELLAWLKEFTAVEGRLYGGIYADVEGKDHKNIAAGALWASASTAIMVASGLTLLDTVKQFRTQTTTRLVLATNQAYASGWTPAQMVGALTRPSALGFTNGLLGNLSSMHDGLTDTLLGSIAGNIQRQYISQDFDGYMWIAILDKATCKRCFKLHGHVFEFGFGPMPPLHARCRCHIVPVGMDTDRPANPDENWASWYARQSPEFRAEVFGDQRRPEPQDALARTLADYANSGNLTVIPA